MPILFRSTVVAAVVLWAAAAGAQEADPRHLAPGFHGRAAGSTLLVVPADMELFSISAGGVEEPRADWTEAAQRNFRAELAARRSQLGSKVVELTEADLDRFGELHALHRAVAEAVFMHHSRSGRKLPTKNDRLDWSLGDAVRPLQAHTGARYALFTWIRDSYASGERKATMFALALLGAFSLGGTQTGYASLVDLDTGRIVWFNDLDRWSGDLRERASASETVDALLKGFPALQ
ncbi:hypothetical protein [Ramlibacter sp.]|uniref:hypothetical protein n=1 Tax=Ramlibacter sp. TaxID=1917967 RepID=UPI002BE6245A|nr:hypothetical protein [Ramlibacter sp.]HWI80525.1 hypothetical protein [Ramlibacter sp.]